MLHALYALLQFIKRLTIDIDRVGKVMQLNFKSTYRRTQLVRRVCREALLAIHRRLEPCDETIYRGNNLVKLNSRLTEINRPKIVCRLRLED